MISNNNFLFIFSNYYTTITFNLDSFFCTLFNLNNDSLFLSEYLFIFVFLIVSFIISVVITFFSYLTAIQNPEVEKLSAYECGFEPYEDARKQINIKFYIIAMLFIIFDLETMYLIPWCVSLSVTNYVGYWLMLDFIFELSIGFLYVWYVGGLDWSQDN